MSLDFYVMASPPKTEGGSGIFVRRNGRIVEISREEWDRSFPGQEPVVFHGEGEIFSANITHNLGKMAAAAGIYDCLWRPEENGITIAAEMIEPLKDGLRKLLGDPDKFKALNPPNGWGDYDGLCRFAREVLAACEENPSVEVHASR